MRTPRPSPVEMIDLHSHILPGIDDGAQSLDESVTMARVASADSIAQLVSTPHSAGWNGAWKNPPTGVKELQEELTRHAIQLRVLPGLEVRIDLDTPAEARDGQVMTLNHSRYLLVELPFDHYPPYVEHVLFELQVSGLVPILAHPERCSIFASNPETLFHLVERGVLVQVTAASIAGEFGPAVQAFTRVLLEHRLAHVIASDAHSARLRPPVLSDAVRIAAGWIGDQEATAMVTTVPRAIVEDRSLCAEPPIQPRAGRRWFRRRRQSYRPT
jgi:protein-tyrosine phosphatase